MRSARRILLAMAVAIFVCIHAASAETTWDHVHLLAPDPAEAAKWYAKHFDGEVTKSGPFEAVLFGKSLVKFKKPPEGFQKNEKASIWAIGFEVADLNAKSQELRAADVKTMWELHGIQPGVSDRAFFEDPWGTRIELAASRPNTAPVVPIRLGYTLLVVDDPEATLKWFADTFGGKREKYSAFAGGAGIDYGSSWLLAWPAIPPKNLHGSGTIDHIGLQVEDFDATVKKLKDAGVKFTVEPRESNGVRMCFIEGPEGILIEVVSGH